MSLLTFISGRVSRNSLRVLASKSNIILVPTAALTHSKADALSSFPDEQVVKTITRKKYAELPLFRKLPDGSNASPLDEWSGGLEILELPLKVVSEEVSADSKSELVPVREEGPREPPRKRRKTQKTDALHVNLNAETASPVQVQGVLRFTAKAEDNLMQDESSDDIIEAIDDTATTARKRRGRSKLTTKAEDGQVQEFVKEISSSHNALVVSHTLPAKLRRKLQRAIKNKGIPGGMVESVKRDTPHTQAKRKVPGKEKVRRSSGTSYSTMDGERRMPQNQLATEILENLAKFPHCILLTRVGNFYESYFDQAAEVAQLLSIKLTKRIWDRQEVLMCGFPIMHLDKYLKVLVQTHKCCVAMCEEFRRTTSEEGFDRRVVRVLTPGTLIDEPFLNPYENNYLLAVGVPPQSLEDIHTYDSRDLNSIPLQESLGLAWIDVSTGEFFAQESTLSSFKDDLARIAPREVVLDASLKEQTSHPIHLAVSDEGSFVSYISPQGAFSPLEKIDLMSPTVNVEDLKMVPSLSQHAQMAPVFTNNESSAISLLILFLQSNLLEHMPILSRPSLDEQQNRMQIDSQTIKALEIRESIREGGVTGSLMSVVKRTVTTSGTRLLSRWLCSPSISITEIQARQNIVALFYSRRHLRDDLTALLKHQEDASRIVQRFLLGKGDVNDLSAIKNTIGIWEEIKSRAELESRLEAQASAEKGANDWAALEVLLHRIANLQGLARRIEMAVTDKHGNSPSAEDGNTSESLVDLNDVIRTGVTTDKEDGSRRWTIRPEFSDELLSLHTRLKEAEAEKKILEEGLRKRYRAPSLTLRSSGTHGVHVHIANARRDSADMERSRHFIAIASTGTTKAFFNQTWYLLGSRIIETILQILSAEKNAFETLRREVNIEANALRRNARIMDELDVTLGFANLAAEMNLVRPVLDESSSYSIKNGRHPSVELGLFTSGRVFTPNTVSLTSESRLHIITGPNMAGKSTLLRQTALLAVLAQTGSFVPADRAEMGIVDKLFSRVGAKDDLFRDRSTFMVEMLETAEILNRATERSLVIMDEVGRGTTVKDGLAIAFATVCHLYNVNRCRTLFATHFHEIVDLLGYVEGSPQSSSFKGVGFFCTDVTETEDGYFTYSHKLRPGVNRDSHGLKVARLAGVPPAALRIAHEALDWMRAKNDWFPDKEQLRAAGEAMATGKIEMLNENK